MIHRCIIIDSWYNWSAYLAMHLVFVFNCHTIHWVCYIFQYTKCINWQTLKTLYRSNTIPWWAGSDIVTVQYAVFVPPTIIQIFIFQYTHTLGLFYETVRVYLDPTVLIWVCMYLPQYSGSVPLKCCGYVSPTLYTLVLNLPQYCEYVSPIILWTWISHNAVGTYVYSGSRPPTIQWVCISHNTVSLYLPQYSGSGPPAIQWVCISHNTLGLLIPYYPH